MRGGLLTLVLVASALSACAARPQLPVMRYELQSQAVMSTREDLMRALWRHSSLHGWQIVRFDEARGVVEALTPTEDRDGVQTRSRWTFQANDGELIVALRLELADTGALQFATEEAVCDSYRYSQEREQLRRVASMLGADVAWVARQP